MPTKIRVGRPPTAPSRHNAGRAKTDMGQVAQAVGIAFERPWAHVVAALGAAGMAVLLVWSAGLLAYYPTGWELFATPQELATMTALSALFGLLVPLQIAALSRAHSVARAVGGLAGAVAGIFGVSCCAPLLISALLSF